MIKELENAFSPYKNPAQATQMSDYLRGQFPFLGIKAPLRKQLSKEVIRHWNLFTFKEAIAISKELLQKEEREYHYISIEFMAKFKKYWDANLLTLITHYTNHKAWWDTIDTASSHLLEPYFAKNGPNMKQLKQWNSSANIWQIRLSIIWQLHQKNNVDKALLTNAILPHLDSKEFFIQKAIGWALRSYSKYNPEWVISFVENNPLAALSKREALKRL